MDDVKIDANEVIRNLATQVANLASENAVLRAQITALQESAHSHAAEQVPE